MKRSALPSEISLARSLYPGAEWKNARVEEGGQFHLVLVAPGEAVLRMSRTQDAALQMQRRVDLVEALAPRLDFAVPTALTPIWHGEDCSAVVQRFIPGSAHPPLRGDPRRL